MVHMSRRAAAVSAEVAALLLAGVVALPALRRRLRHSSGQAREEPNQGDPPVAGPVVPGADSTSSTSALADDGHDDGQAAVGDPSQVDRGGVLAPVGHDDGADQGTSSGPGQAPKGGADDGREPGLGASVSRATHPKPFVRGRLTAARAYTRQGFIPAVRVLLVLTIAPATYGWLHRPDTTVPQPASSNIEVDFSQSHPALSPITVGVRLLRDDPSPNGEGSTVTLAIDLSGEDFTHAGWEVYADVPAGVDVSEVRNTPQPYTSHGMAYVYIHPGPQRSGGYTALLEWHNLTSGPLQVIGANMVAAFPSVTVINQTKDALASVPTPRVTVNRALAPWGDFTYQGGIPPDEFVGVYWQWSPVIGTVEQPALADDLNVEAKSASLDGQAHTAEFYSGIAFGVAFAAFIACVVEFVKADRGKRNPSPRAPGEATAATASSPGQTPPDP
jgi:hypothetical protein